MWVVTNPELGWDCVIGVFSKSIPLEEMQKAFPNDIIHDQVLGSKEEVANWIKELDF